MADPWMQPSNKSKYWQNMLRKYEERNARLQSEECQLRHKLEALECSLPIMMCMNAMNQPQPNQSQPTEITNQTQPPIWNTNLAPNYQSGIPIRDVKSSEVTGNRTPYGSCTNCSKVASGKCVCKHAPSKESQFSQKPLPQSSGFASAPVINLQQVKKCDCADCSKAKSGDCDCGSAQSKDPHIAQNPLLPSSGSVSAPVINPLHDKKCDCTDCSKAKSGDCDCGSAKSKDPHIAQNPLLPSSGSVSAPVINPLHDKKCECTDCSKAKSGDCDCGSAKSKDPHIAQNPLLPSSGSVSAPVINPQHDKKCDCTDCSKAKSGDCDCGSAQSKDPRIAQNPLLPSSGSGFAPSINPQSNKKCDCVDCTKAKSGDCDCGSAQSKDPRIAQNPLLPSSGSGFAPVINPQHDKKCDCTDCSKAKSGDCDCGSAQSKDPRIAQNPLLPSSGSGFAPSINPQSNKKCDCVDCTKAKSGDCDCGSAQSKDPGIAQNPLLQSPGSGFAPIINSQSGHKCDCVDCSKAKSGDCDCGSAQSKDPRIAQNPLLPSSGSGFAPIINPQSNKKCDCVDCSKAKSGDCDCGSAQSKDPGIAQNALLQSPGSGFAPIINSQSGHKCDCVDCSKAKSGVCDCGPALPNQPRVDSEQIPQSSGTAPAPFIAPQYAAPQHKRGREDVHAKTPQKSAFLPANLRNELCTCDDCDLLPLGQCDCGVGSSNRFCPCEDCELLAQGVCDCGPQNDQSFEKYPANVLSSKLVPSNKTSIPSNKSTSKPFKPCECKFKKLKKSSKTTPMAPRIKRDAPFSEQEISITYPMAQDEGDPHSARYSAPHSSLTSAGPSLQVPQFTRTFAVPAQISTHSKSVQHNPHQHQASGLHPGFSNKNCDCKKCKLAATGECKCLPETKSNNALSAAPLQYRNDDVSLLDSEDFLLIEKVKRLAEKEKVLKHNINELYHKENALNETIETVHFLRGTPNNATIPVENNQPNMMENLQRLNNSLLQENGRMSDELADVKLDMKQMKEKLEGPMQREMEREKRKTKHMEDDLVRATDEKNRLGETMKKEIEFLKMQLETAAAQSSDLNTINSRLKEELIVMDTKCNDLHQDLINHKISEANTLSRIKAGQTAESPLLAPCAPCKEFHVAQDQVPHSLGFAPIINPQSNKKCNCADCSKAKSGDCDCGSAQSQDPRIAQNPLLPSSGSVYAPVINPQHDKKCDCTDCSKAKSGDCDCGSAQSKDPRIAQNPLLPSSGSVYAPVINPQHDKKCDCTDCSKAKSGDCDCGSAQSKDPRIAQNPLLPSSGSVYAPVINPQHDKKCDCTDCSKAKSGDCDCGSAQSKDPRIAQNPLLPSSGSVYAPVINPQHDKKCDCTDCSKAKSGDCDCGSAQSKDPRIAQNPLLPSSGSVYAPVINPQHDKKCDCTDCSKAKSGDCDCGSAQPKDPRTAQNPLLQSPGSGFAPIINPQIGKKYICTNCSKAIGECECKATNAEETVSVASSLQPSPPPPSEQTFVSIEQSNPFVAEKAALKMLPENVPTEQQNNTLDGQNRQDMNVTEPTPEPVKITTKPTKARDKALTDGSSLDAIARDLSNLLHENENNKNIPKNMKDTAFEIKELVDFVDKKLGKSPSNKDKMGTKPTRELFKRKVKNESEEVLHPKKEKGNCVCLENVLSLLSKKLEEKWQQPKVSSKVNDIKQDVKKMETSIGKVEPEDEEFEDAIDNIDDENIVQETEKELFISNFNSDKVGETGNVINHVEDSDKAPLKVVNPTESSKIEPKKGLKFPENMEANDEYFKDNIPQDKFATTEKQVEQEKPASGLPDKSKPVTSTKSESINANAGNAKTVPGFDPVLLLAAGIETGESSPNKDVALATTLHGPGKTSKTSKPSSAIEVETELETDGDVEVNTKIMIVKKKMDGINVTTTMTKSGTLEVITEGPAGVIETVMKLTESGNIEVVTQITDFDDENDSSEEETTTDTETGPSSKKDDTDYSDDEHNRGGDGMSGPAGLDNSKTTKGSSDKNKGYDNNHDRPCTENNPGECNPCSRFQKAALITKSLPDNILLKDISIHKQSSEINNELAEDDVLNSSDWTSESNTNISKGTLEQSQAVELNAGYNNGGKEQVRLPNEKDELKIIKTEAKTITETLSITPKTTTETASFDKIDVIEDNTKVKVPSKAPSVTDEIMTEEKPDLNVESESKTSESVSKVTDVLKPENTTDIITEKTVLDLNVISDSKMESTSVKTEQEASLKMNDIKSDKDISITSEVNNKKMLEKKVSRDTNDIKSENNKTPVSSGVSDKIEEHILDVSADLSLSQSKGPWKSKSKETIESGSPPASQIESEIVSVKPESKIIEKEPSQTASLTPKSNDKVISDIEVETIKSGSPPASQIESEIVSVKPESIKKAPSQTASLKPKSNDKVISDIEVETIKSGSPPASQIESEIVSVKPESIKKAPQTASLKPKSKDKVISDIEVETIKSGSPPASQIESEIVSIKPESIKKAPSQTASLKPKSNDKVISDIEVETIKSGSPPASQIESEIVSVKPESIKKAPSQTASLKPKSKDKVISDIEVETIKSGSPPASEIESEIVSIKPESIKKAPSQTASLKPKSNDKVISDIEVETIKSGSPPASQIESEIVSVKPESIKKAPSQTASLKPKSNDKVISDIEVEIIKSGSPPASQIESEIVSVKPESIKKAPQTASLKPKSKDKVISDIEVEIIKSGSPPASQIESEIVSVKPESIKKAPQTASLKPKSKDKVISDIEVETIKSGSPPASQIESEIVSVKPESIKKAPSQTASLKPKSNDKVISDIEVETIKSGSPPASQIESEIVSVKPESIKKAPQTASLKPKSKDKVISDIEVETIKSGSPPASQIESEIVSIKPESIKKAPSQTASLKPKSNDKVISDIEVETIKSGSPPASQIESEIVSVKPESIKKAPSQTASLKPKSNDKVISDIEVEIIKSGSPAASQIESQIVSVKTESIKKAPSQTASLTPKSNDKVISDIEVETIKSGSPPASQIESEIVSVKPESIKKAPQTASLKPKSKDKVISDIEVETIKSGSPPASQIESEIVSIKPESIKKAPSQTASLKPKSNDKVISDIEVETIKSGSPPASQIESEIVSVKPESIKKAPSQTASLKPKSKDKVISDIEVETIKSGSPPASQIESEIVSIKPESIKKAPSQTASLKPKSNDKVISDIEVETIKSGSPAASQIESEIVSVKPESIKKAPSQTASLKPKSKDKVISDIEVETIKSGSPAASQIESEIVSVKPESIKKAPSQTASLKPKSNDKVISDIEVETINSGSPPASQIESEIVSANSESKVKTPQTVELKMESAAKVINDIKVETIKPDSLSKGEIESKNESELLKQPSKSDTFDSNMSIKDQSKKTSLRIDEVVDEADKSEKSVPKHDSQLVESKPIMKETASIAAPDKSDEILKESAISLPKADSTNIMDTVVLEKEITSVPGKKDSISKGEVEMPKISSEEDIDEMNKQKISYGIREGVAIEKDSDEINDQIIKDEVMLKILAEIREQEGINIDDMDDKQMQEYLNAKIMEKLAEQKDSDEMNEQITKDDVMLKIHDEIREQEAIDIDDMDDQQMQEYLNAKIMEKLAEQKDSDEMNEQIIKDEVMLKIHDEIREQEAIDIDDMDDQQMQEYLNAKIMEKLAEQKDSDEMNEQITKDEVILKILDEICEQEGTDIDEMDDQQMQEYLNAKIMEKLAEQKEDLCSCEICNCIIEESEQPCTCLECKCSLEVSIPILECRCKPGYCNCIEQDSVIADIGSNGDAASSYKECVCKPGYCKCIDLDNNKTTQLSLTGDTICSCKPGYCDCVSDSKNQAKDCDCEICVCSSEKSQPSEKYSIKKDSECVCEKCMCLSTDAITIAANEKKSEGIHCSCCTCKDCKCLPKKMHSYTTDTRSDTFEKYINSTEIDGDHTLLSEINKMQSNDYVCPPTPCVCSIKKPMNYENSSSKGTSISDKVRAKQSGSNQSSLPQNMNAIFKPCICAPTDCTCGPPEILIQSKSFVDCICTECTCIYDAFDKPCTCETCTCSSKEDASVRIRQKDKANEINSNSPKSECPVEEINDHRINENGDELVDIKSNISTKPNLKLESRSDDLEENKIQEYETKLQYPINEEDAINLKLWKEINQANREVAEAIKKANHKVNTALQNINKRVEDNVPNSNSRKRKRSKIPVFKGLLQHSNREKYIRTVIPESCTKATLEETAVSEYTSAVSIICDNIKTCKSQNARSPRITLSKDMLRVSRDTSDGKIISIYNEERSSNSNKMLPNYKDILSNSHQFKSASPKLEFGIRNTKSTSVQVNGLNTNLDAQTVATEYDYKNSKSTNATMVSEIDGNAESSKIWDNLFAKIESNLEKYNKLTLTGGNNAKRSSSKKEKSSGRDIDFSNLMFANSDDIGETSFEIGKLINPDVCKYLLNKVKRYISTGDMERAINELDQSRTSPPASQESKSIEMKECNETSKIWLDNSNYLQTHNPTIKNKSEINHPQTKDINIEMVSDIIRNILASDRSGNGVETNQINKDAVLGTLETMSPEWWIEYDNLTNDLQSLCKDLKKTISKDKPLDNITNDKYELDLKKSEKAIGGTSKLTSLQAMTKELLNELKLMKDAQLETAKYKMHDGNILYKHISRDLLLNDSSFGIPSNSELSMFNHSSPSQNNLYSLEETHSSLISLESDMFSNEILAYIPKLNNICHNRSHNGTISRIMARKSYNTKYKYIIRLSDVKCIYMNAKDIKPKNTGTTKREINDIFDQYSSVEVPPARKSEVIMHFNYLDDQQEKTNTFSNSITGINNQKRNPVLPPKNTLAKHKIRNKQTNNEHLNQVAKLHESDIDETDDEWADALEVIPKTKQITDMMDRIPRVMPVDASEQTSDVIMDLGNAEDIEEAHGNSCECIDCLTSPCSKAFATTKTIAEPPIECPMCNRIECIGNCNTAQVQYSNQVQNLISLADRSLGITQSHDMHHQWLLSDGMLNVGDGADSNKDFRSLPCVMNTIFKSNVSQELSASHSKVPSVEGDVPSSYKTAHVTDIYISDKEINNSEEDLDELQNIMKQISSACMKAGSRLSARPTHYQNSATSLQIALKNLQATCNNKDSIIRGMICELQMRIRNSSSIPEEFPEIIDQYYSTEIQNYNQTCISQSPKPEQRKRSSNHNCSDRSSSICWSKSLSEAVLQSCIPSEQAIDVKPLQLTEVKRIGDDSLLVKWQAPTSKSVLGYEVCINEEVKTRVYRRSRTMAVISSPPLKCSPIVQISVYACTDKGRCHPPALASFHI